MNIQRKNINISEIELKFAANGGFGGYASVFGGVDSYNDTIVAGAYKSVIEKIEVGLVQMPKMFVNHKSWDIPVGKWTKMYEDDKGLYVEGEFTKGNPDADKIKAAMQHGTVDGLSIGFMIGDYEIVENEGESMRIIKSIKELPEVSIVTYPADDNARIDLTSVKSALDNINTVRDFEKFLREVAGFSNSLARETAKSAKVLFSHPGDVETDMPEEASKNADIDKQIAMLKLTSSLF
jgi:HK97 family phage prohead protease